jgi:hypothetical protein
MGIVVNYTQQSPKRKVSTFARVLFGVNMRGITVMVLVQWYILIIRLENISANRPRVKKNLIDCVPLGEFGML